MASCTFDCGGVLWMLHCDGVLCRPAPCYDRCATWRWASLALLASALPFMWYVSLCPAIHVICRQRLCHSCDMSAGVGNTWMQYQTQHGAGNAGLYCRKFPNEGPYGWGDSAGRVCYIRGVIIHCSNITACQCYEMYQKRKQIRPKRKQGH